MPLSWTFEPHVAEEVFQEMLAEARAPVLFHHRLAEQDGVEKKGARLTGLRMDDGTMIRGKCFVDASYEGDLVAQAGVSCAIGREGREQYGEALAGVQAVPLGDWEEYRRTASHGPGYSSLMLPTIEWYKERHGYLNSHQWPVKVSGLDAQGRALPGVTALEPGSTAQGDRKFMAYNFRLCLTRQEANRLPIERPANYDPLNYELVARYVAQWPDIRLGQLFFIGRMPGNKADFNSSGPFSSDYLGACWDYPTASYEKRRAIWQSHKDWLQGYLWFLGHDPRLPETLRAETLEWGLCRDEFADTDHWPRQLYVRISRRMVSDYIMQQKDVQTEIVKPDSVGMGSFIIDSHNIQRVLTRDGFVVNEGGIEVPSKPYQVPYRALLPKKAECENLLSPVSLSASYIAYCTMRMEPVYMQLGHASGLAAVQAAETGQAVQDIKVPTLQAQLKEQRQVLALPPPPPVPALNSLPGIVVDDRDAQLTGKWIGSDFGGRGIGGHYLHDGDNGKGQKSIRYEAHLPADGLYEVRLAYPPYDNRAAKVPVTIESAEGRKTVFINERHLPPIDGTFISLGRYPFKTSQPAAVIICNDDTKGYVVADVVQWLPVK